MDNYFHCDVCTQDIDVEGGESLCDHTPDIFLETQEFEHRLYRTRKYGDTSRREELKFSIPEHWAQWVFETHGVSITESGQYRLPGMLWEWCLLKLREEEATAAFVEKNINEYLEKIGQ